MSKLLIVDDDDSVCTLVTDYIGSAFESIDRGHSVPQAIGHLKQNHYSIIILDLNLGQGDGQSVLRYLRREDSQNRNVPVLVISGERELQNKEDRLTSFLSKPFDDKELKEALNQLVKKAKGSAKTKDPKENTSNHPELVKILKGS